MGKLGFDLWMMRCLFKIQYEESQRLYSYHINVIYSVFHRMSSETTGKKLYALILFLHWLALKKKMDVGESRMTFPELLKTGSMCKLVGLTL